MTRTEIEVLGLAHEMTPKSYFDSFPGKLRIAKSLMWDGFIESAGPLGDFLRLTPAGEAVFRNRTARTEAVTNEGRE